MKTGNIILIGKWIFIILFMMPGWGQAEIIMKNIGGILHTKKLDPYDLTDLESQKAYLFPCLDKRHEPQYVMILLKESDFSRRTIQMYKFNDLLDFQQEVNPIKTYPQHGKMKGPAAFNAPEVPWAFHLGLYFLVKGDGYWTIQQFAPYKKIYDHSQMPWFFDATKIGFAYARNNKIYAENHSTLSQIHSENNILSFHIPHHDYQLINYYNDHHNPDIQLKIKNKLIYYNNQNISELYPKFSQDKQYFAFFQNEPNQQDQWQLLIYKTSHPKHPFNIINNVKIYDFEETAFFFHDAFQWMENKIYYQKCKTDAIYQFDPVRLREKKMRFQNGQYSWNQQIKGQPGSCKLDVTIIAKGWFQVAIYQNKISMVVECFVYTKSTIKTFVSDKSVTLNENSKNDKFGAVNRILIFQEQE
jgi:hypothetical protein